MDVWEQINDILRIIAWPSVVIVLAVVFRANMRSLLDRIRSAKGPAGTEFVFDPALAQAALLTREIEDDASTLVAGEQEAIEAEAIRPDDDDDERARRRAIENIIKSSVRSGYQLGSRGASVTPVPVITWENGLPSVDGFDPDILGLSEADARRFETRRRGLLHQLNLLIGLGDPSDEERRRLSAKVRELSYMELRSLNRQLDDEWESGREVDLPFLVDRIEAIERRRALGA